MMDLDDYPLLSEPNVMLLALKAATLAPAVPEDCLRQLEKSLRQIHKELPADMSAGSIASPPPFTISVLQACSIPMRMAAAPLHNGARICSEIIPRALIPRCSSRFRSFGRSSAIRARYPRKPAMNLP